MGPPPLKSNFKNFAPACTSSRRSLKPPLFQSRRLRDSCRRQGLAVPCRRDEFSKLFLGLSKFFNSRVFNRIAATSRAYKSFSSLVSSLSSSFLSSLPPFVSFAPFLSSWLSFLIEDKWTRQISFSFLLLLFNSTVLYFLFVSSLVKDDTSKWIRKFSPLPFQFFYRRYTKQNEFDKFLFPLLLFFLPIIQLERYTSKRIQTNFFFFPSHPFPPIVSTPSPPFSFLVLIHRFSPYREDAHKHEWIRTPGEQLLRPGTVQFRDNVISCCWQPTTAAVSVIRKNVLPSLCQTSSFG